MNVAVFSTKEYDRHFFEQENATLGENGHELEFFETRLTDASVSLACEFDAVCVFVNDVLSRTVIDRLAGGSAKTIALRCAGFNNVDLEAARSARINIVRVPEYSPHAVAEHSIGLLLSLNRQLHRAYNRVRDGDFRLSGLLGFDLHEKTVGVVGTGRIGECVCRILRGFGCRVIASDPNPSDSCLEMGVEYVDVHELFQRSKVVILQCPLIRQTQHLINQHTVSLMPDDVVIINTSRGGVIDTRAVIDGLKSGKIGGLGIDVYEEEADLFFEDLSSTVITDDVFARLLTFPNVLITGHQGFFTREALSRIASVTLNNLSEIESSGSCVNAVQ
ncbi:MAG: 2-hydroxyacid dehydrogenase [Planctomycetota bacterium]